MHRERGDVGCGERSKRGHRRSSQVEPQPFTVQLLDARHTRNVLEEGHSRRDRTPRLRSGATGAKSAMPSISTSRPAHAESPPGRIRLLPRPADARLREHRLAPLACFCDTAAKILFPSTDPCRLSARRALEAEPVSRMQRQGPPSAGCRSNRSWPACRDRDRNGRPTRRGRPRRHRSPHSQAAQGFPRPSVPATAQHQPARMRCDDGTDGRHPHRNRISSRCLRSGESIRAAGGSSSTCRHRWGPGTRTPRRVRRSYSDPRRPQHGRTVWSDRRHGWQG